MFGCVEMDDDNVGVALGGKTERSEMTDCVGERADKHTYVGGGHKTWDGVQKEKGGSGSTGAKMKLTGEDGAGGGIAGFEMQQFGGG